MFNGNFGFGKSPRHFMSKIVWSAGVCAALPGDMARLRRAMGCAIINSQMGKMEAGT